MGQHSGCCQTGDQQIDRRARASGIERNQKHISREFGFIREALRGFLKEEKVYTCPQCFKKINLPMVYKEIGVWKDVVKKEVVFPKPSRRENRKSE